jgi:hypothetical protein
VAGAAVVCGESQSQAACYALTLKNANKMLTKCSQKTLGCLASDIDSKRKNHPKGRYAAQLFVRVANAQRRRTNDRQAMIKKLIKSNSYIVYSVSALNTERVNHE